MYVPAFISDNAITLTNKIQVIARFYGEPSDIHRSYDFVHAKCYYDYHNDVLDTPVESLRSMQSRVLKYEGSLYPICSLFRMRKFINRGWKISAGEILKISLQVNAIKDLLTVDTLRDQLVGCDALYFNKLIWAIESNSNTEITHNYVSAIVDRIFNDE